MFRYNMVVLLLHLGKALYGSFPNIVVLLMTEMCSTSRIGNYKVGLNTQLF